MEYSETERIWSHVGGQLNFQDSAKCSHRMMRSSINDVHKMCSRDSTIIHETLTGRTESKESVLQILTTIIKDPIDVNLGRINLFTARFTEVSRCLPIPASVVN